MKYYIARDGAQAGPFDKENLLGEGVKPTTLVWHEGMETWQQACSLPELKNLWAAPTAPVIPPIPDKEVASSNNISNQNLDESYSVTNFQQEIPSQNGKRLGLTLTMGLISLTFSIICIILGLVIFIDSEDAYSWSCYYGDYYFYSTWSDFVSEGAVCTCSIIGIISFVASLIAMIKGRCLKGLKVVSLIFSILAMLMAMSTVLLCVGVFN